MNNILSKTLKISAGLIMIMAFIGMAKPSQANAQYYYPYNYNQSYYQYSQLTAYCYPSTTSSNTGDVVTWRAAAYGGNGNYSIVWSGSDGLSGYGTSISRIYNYTGTKYASISVTSDGRTINQSCNNNVIVYGNNNYNYNYNNYNYPYYNPPVVQYTYPQYYTNQVVAPVYTPITYGNNLQVSCYPNKDSATVGSLVTWNAEVTGGYGNYIYAWTGTDGLSSSLSSVAKTYSTSGSKSATVTVTSSNGQSATQACSGTVEISRPVVVQPVTYVAPIVYPNNNQQQQYYNPNTQNTDISAASLFSLANIPWGWVIVLIILVLMFTVMYLIFNRNKI